MKLNRIAGFYGRMAVAVSGAMFSLFLFFSCSDSEGDEPPQRDDAVTTLLVYALSDNSLESYFPEDLDEMKKALTSIDTDKYRLLVYNSCPDKYLNGSGPALVEYRNDNGMIKEYVVREYDRSVSSADPERLKEVISDFISFSPSENRGIFLWSHAMGWLPGVKSFSPSKKRWFGEDAGRNMDIDVLADALPGGVFDFIWMDCCYMGNMETIYQLRNKAEYYVASPTETLAYGAPYDIILPYLLCDRPDVIAAARSMFDFYDSQVGAMQSCTVVVADLGECEGVAEAARKIQTDYVPLQSTSGLQRYHRFSHGPYYDFFDVESAIASASGPGEECLNELRTALSRMIIYKGATRRFLYTQGGFEILPSKFSGVSCTPPRYDGSPREDYYFTLDWARATFPGTID